MPKMERFSCNSGMLAVTATLTFKKNGELPVAPSAVKEIGEIRVPEGKLETVTPRALRPDEIPGIVNDYKTAAQNAIEAGFDGIEIHAANGYLIDQFSQDGTNKRTDNYGGSIENRCRFMLEVVEAISKALGSERVGIRLSPSGRHAGISDSNPKALFEFAIRQLNNYNLVYLHLVEAIEEVDHLENYVTEVTKHYREFYKGTIISCGNYNAKSAQQAIDSGITDLVAFGRDFISNPDLPERILNKAPLNPYDPKTFYGGNEKGYTDYPFLKPGNDKAIIRRYCCKL
jgi:N-ethylmaleimide reductase